MKKIIPPIWFFLLSNIGIANGLEDSKVNYQKAFDELNAMLNNEVPLSFKRAVFITENAYLENSLSYEDFTGEIDFLVGLAKSIMTNGSLNYDYPDRNIVERSAAIYSVMKKATSFVIPHDSGMWAVERKPYTYDLEDFWGEGNWTKMFVSKLLATQTGNCHSMPALYKILAEEMDVPAYLSIAPNHTYIKQWSDKTGWYNTELTTGSFPFDKDIKWNSYIKTEAVAKGIYMDTVSRKQSIAYVITDLAQGYIKKYGYQDVNTPINWLNSALSHYPNYVNALILKAELQKKQLEQLMVLGNVKDFRELSNRSDLQSSFSDLEISYFKIHQLGYRKMPKEMYLNWLFRIHNDTTRKPHKFETPQPFKEYGYEVYMATAGDGYNYEFYDQDTLARIGTVELNRLTGKIVKFVEYDYSTEMPDDVISRMYDPALGRFWQVDPKANQRDWLTPYNYGRNNPIFFVDPDGQLDNYFMNANGDINVERTDDESDTFTYVDSDGNEHNLGTFAKNENGMIQVPNLNFDDGEISFGLSVKEGNESQSFASGEGLAAILGALAESGTQDFTVTRMSNSDGSSPGDSESHGGGKNFDSRFLRKDGSGGALNINNDFAALDQGRQGRMNAALKKFGFKRNKASRVIQTQNQGVAEFETYTTHNVRGTTHLPNHYDHMHSQGFYPRVQEIVNISIAPLSKPKK